MPKKNRPDPNVGRPKARKTKYSNPAIEEAIRAATAAAKAQKPADQPTKKKSPEQTSAKAESRKPEKPKPAAGKADRPTKKVAPPPPPPVEESEQEEAQSITFADLDLADPIARGISDLGFEAPTPIQARAIPVLLTGRDMIGQAQTGTGKTAAFALPLLHKCDPNTLGVQALVLEPTRELAVQVGGGIFDLGRHTGLRVASVFGGQPFDRQIRMLQSGAQIVVGTPGRILDHLRRGTLDLSNVRYCVLDEADEMLALGFIEDIETILAELPETRQTAFFSATMPPRVAGLTDRFLNDPVRVSIESKRRTVETIQQTYYDVRPGRKLDALARVLDMETPGSTIVFCRTRQETSDLADALRLRGYAAEALNGEMAQSERDRVMRRFRDGQADLLIATDVAARGLDIESVTHVINYDIPWDVEQYIHRIGRTGRAGRAGDAITLVEGRERRQLEFIERMTGAKITPVRVPTAADIVARRREVFTERLRETLEARTFDGYLDTVEELCEEFDPAEVAAAAIQMLWQERHPTEAGTAEELAADREQPEQGMTRLFIGMGRQDGLRPGDIVGAISNEAGIPGKAIGAIDILDHTSFVEVPRPDVERIIDVLRNTKLRGRKVKVEVVMGEKQQRSKEGQARGGKQKAYRGRP